MRHVQIPEHVVIPSRFLRNLVTLIPKKIQLAIAFRFVIACASFTEKGLDATLREVLDDLEANRKGEDDGDT